MERRNIQLPPYVDAEIIDTVTSHTLFVDVLSSTLAHSTWDSMFSLLSLQVYKAVGHNTRNSGNAYKGRGPAGGNNNNLGSQRDDQEDDYSRGMI